MARYAKRASRYSPPGEMEVFRDESAAFGALETAYRRTIPDDAKGELTQICAEYLTWRRAEVESATYSDVRETWANVKRATAAFASLAFGEVIPADDAGTQVRNVFERHMRDVPIHFRAGLIASIPSEAPLASGALIELSMKALTDINIALQAAVKRADAEMAALSVERGGFVPGDAFPGFVEKLKGWAKKWNLPRSPLHSDGSAAPFGSLLFTLDGLFPAGLRLNFNSADAAAERIKKVRTRPQ